MGKATIDRVRAEELLKAGMTYQEVADEIGCSRPGLLKAVPGYGKYSRLSREEVERVKSLTAAGWSVPKIAAELGCKTRRVEVIRQKHGFYVQSYRGRTNFTEDQLRWAEMLLKEGAPYSEVAETLGCTTNGLMGRFPGHGYRAHGISLGEQRAIERLEKQLGLVG